MIQKNQIENNKKANVSELNKLLKQHAITY